MFQWALELLRGLVEAGADIHACDKTGASPAALGGMHSSSRGTPFNNGSMYQCIWPKIRQEAAQSNRSRMILERKTKKRFLANVENSSRSSPNATIENHLTPVQKNTQPFAIGKSAQGKSSPSSVWNNNTH